ncbi:MAG TPA: cell division protein SepF [Clostridia bacterium]|nr:cell division protein SepF [Clostridia bacterium]
MAREVELLAPATKRIKPKRKEIGVICPEKFSDVENVIEQLRRKESLIVDFENIPPTLAQRMLDFLSGGVFALSGTVRKLKYKMYILIPQGVKISSVRKE